METALVNRVAQSGLITLDLETFFPEGDVIGFDFKDYLFMGMILKEKDFRESMSTHNWAPYEGQHLAIFCSADAIIPMWAYMLVAAHAAPFAAGIAHCHPDQYIDLVYTKIIDQLDLSPYQDKRIVVKGCSEKPVPASAYLDITRRLQPVAKSIMFGEPCSTVPVYKQKV